MADDSRNWPLPLAMGDHPWGIEAPEPTNLLAFFACEGASPDPETIRGSFEAQTGKRVEHIDTIETDDDAVTWCVVLRISMDEALRTPLVIWLERAQPSLASPEIDLDRCNWILGCETLLNIDDPLTDYRMVLCLLRGALEEVVAVLDVNTTKWHLRSDLDALIERPEIEPPEEMLWLVHCVTGNRASGTSPSWLHTHGLWRCGRPELEMLEVPADMSGAAAALINDIACLLLDTNPTACPPEESLSIGPDLSVVLRPWTELMDHLLPGAPGGRADRTGDAAAAHTGPRAVVTDVQTPNRAWPREVLDRRTRDDVVIYRTRRATARQELLARSTWPSFVRLFQIIMRDRTNPAVSDDAIFGVKAGYSHGPDENGREHLWFRIVRVEGEDVTGRLLNQPRWIDTMHEGDVITIEASDVSDWRIMLEGEQFDPSSPERVEELLRRFESEQVSES